MNSNNFDSFEEVLNSYLEGKGNWKVSLILSSLIKEECVDPKLILNSDNYDYVFLKENGNKKGKSWILIVKINEYY